MAVKVTFGGLGSEQATELREALTDGAGRVVLSGDVASVWGRSGEVGIALGDVELKINPPRDAIEAELLR